MDLVAYPPTLDSIEIIANTKVFARAWGEGEQKGTRDTSWTFLGTSLADGTRRVRARVKVRHLGEGFELS